MPITWTTEQLLKHIEEVAARQKLIHITIPNDPIPLFILFKYPPRSTVLRAELEESRATYKAKGFKILSEVEMDALMREKGIWSEVDDEKVTDIQEKIVKWTLKTQDPDISPNSKQYAKELILKLEEDLFKTEVRRERMMAQTVERKARQAKYDFMLWACSWDPDTNRRCWDNYLTFCEKVEVNLKNQILSEFLKYLVGHNTEEIRYIARSNLWRLDFVIAQKGNLHLFNRAAVDLTPDQKNLLWWSSYYQSIYELLPDDQPDDWVVQDDEALDKYMKELHQERSNEQSSRRAEKQGTTSAERMAERLIMRSHPDYLKREYDVVNPHAIEGQTDIRVDDDMEGRRQEKLKGMIQRAKKFTPKKEE
jgi:hypothetical protein